MAEYLKKINRSSVVQRVIDRLTEAIVSGELKPGDRIPTEMELAEQMGVARNSIREAVKILVYIGVLEIRRADGTFVCDGFSESLIDPMVYGIILNQQNEQELNELRTMIESGVMRLAIEKASDKELAELMDKAGYQFSSANSINIGRLVPQIVYYVYAYAKLYENGAIAKDEKINVVVPTGNFGNILAAFYAKNLGLPIAKLICASNENKVLFDFFSTGTYDRNREFVLTSSPSMDILISSNLERLIYRIAGNDAEKNAEFMRALTEEGKYMITDEMRAQLADFYGNYTTEEETAEVIRDLYEKTGYVIDTHTAVATGVYHKYVKETGDNTKTVIASTASPFKFTRSVMDAIDKEKYDSMTDFELVDELSKIANVKVPQAIEDIRSAEVLHKTECDVEDMPKTVKAFLNI